MQLCPCGSKSTYDQCCGLFIERKQKPETPEQLMRSRYTAYSKVNTAYIKNTMKGKPLLDFKEEEAKKWCANVTWLSLNVLNSFLESPTKGFVEFKASLLDGNQLITFQELSAFQKDEEQWFYIDGSEHNTLKQKIGRNEPCPCGSGKKFKNCHE